MSRISPFHFRIEEYDEQEIQNICPRYIKWLQKVRAFDFSKRRKGKIERTLPTLPTYETNYKRGDSSKTQKKSRGFVSKIRRGGQNLRVRCRTSADLWRRWIRGGLMYNTELIEMDEHELEVQETKSKVEIKIETKPNESLKDKPIEKLTVTEIVVDKPEPTIEKTEDKRSEDQNLIETEAKIEIIDNKVTETNETQSITEDKTEKNEEISELKVEDISESKAQEMSELKVEEVSEEEAKEVLEPKVVLVSEIKAKALSEPKAEENGIISIANSNSSLNNSSHGMPEVVDSND